MENRVNTSVHVLICPASGIFMLLGYKIILQTATRLAIKKTVIGIIKWLKTTYVLIQHALLQAFKGRLHYFSMQVVMNKCFLILKKKLVQIRLVVFEKNAKNSLLIPKNDVTEPKTNKQLNC